MVPCFRSLQQHPSLDSPSFWSKDCKVALLTAGHGVLVVTHPRATTEVHTARTLDLLRKFLVTPKVGPSLGYLVQPMWLRGAVRRGKTFTLDFR